MRAPQPFNFDEFGAKAEKNEEMPAEYLAAIETARAEGLAEGRRLAMATIAADETALLADIAQAFEARRTFFEKEILATGVDLVELTRAFMEEFCGALATSREIEIAGDFLKSLVDHSDDRRAVTLRLAPTSAERLGPKLSDLINSRGLSAFVLLAQDEKLKAGEVRIDWRGGGAKRTRAEIASSVETLIQSFNAAKGAQATEAQS